MNWNLCLTTLAAAATAAVLLGTAVPAGAATTATATKQPAKMTQVAAVAVANPRILDAQKALAKANFDPGKQDGQMGPKTRAAITAFQKAKSLKETGTLDVFTLAALGVR